MNWLNHLERKLGKYAIKRLMIYILSLNFLVFLLMLTNQFEILNLLRLDPGLVLQGQVWRLISFIFIPPSFSPIFILFVLYFYYLIGVSLEEEWGSFKFNLYYFTGMLATIVAAFIAGGASGIFLNLSLFLAFAFLFPNFEIRLFFILPVKIKYLAWVYWVIIIYTIVFGTLTDQVATLASIVNYFLFFGGDILRRIQLKRQVNYNRRRFFNEINRSNPIHKCEVCGITEKKDPRMDFSYCKECDGDYEYCTKHILQHNHVKRN